MLWRVPQHDMFDIFFTEKAFDNDAAMMSKVSEVEIQY